MESAIFRSALLGMRYEDYIKMYHPELINVSENNVKIDYEDEEWVNNNEYDDWVNKNMAYVEDVIDNTFKTNSKPHYEKCYRYKNYLDNLLNKLNECKNILDHVDNDIQVRRCKHYKDFKELNLKPCKSCMIDESDIPYIYCNNNCKSCKQFRDIKQSTLEKVNKTLVSRRLKEKIEKDSLHRTKKFRISDNIDILNKRGNFRDKFLSVKFIFNMSDLDVYSKNSLVDLLKCNFNKLMNIKGLKCNGYLSSIVFDNIQVDSLPHLVGLIRYECVNNIRLSSSDNRFLRKHNININGTYINRDVIYKMLLKPADIINWIETMSANIEFEGNINSILSGWCSLAT